MPAYDLVHDHPAPADERAQAPALAIDPTGRAARGQSAELQAANKAAIALIANELHQGACAPRALEAER